MMKILSQECLFIYVVAFRRLTIKMDGPQGPSLSLILLMMTQNWLNTATIHLESETLERQRRQNRYPLFCLMT